MILTFFFLPLPSPLFQIRTMPGYMNKTDLKTMQSTTMTSNVRVNSHVGNSPPVISTNNPASIRPTKKKQPKKALWINIAIFPKTTKREPIIRPCMKKFRMPDATTDETTYDHTAIQTFLRNQQRHFTNSGWMALGSKTTIVQKSKTTGRTPFSASSAPAAPTP